MKSLRFAPVWLVLALALVVPSLASASLPTTASSWTVAESLPQKARDQVYGSWEPNLRASEVVR